MITHLPMAQDDSFVFNSKQGTVSQTVSQNVVASPISDPMTLPSTPQGQVSQPQTIPNPIDSLPAQEEASPNPVITSAAVTAPSPSLPDITNYSTHAINDRSAPALPKVDQTPNIPSSTVNLNASEEIMTLDPTTTQDASAATAAPVVPTDSPATPVTQPQPDFRALAEEVVMGEPNLGTTTAVIPSPTVTVQAQIADQVMGSINQPPVVPSPNPVVPTPISVPSVVPAAEPTLIQTPVLDQSNMSPSQISPNITQAATPYAIDQSQAEPQLETDPFIQEIHETDVKVEQEALETLIASSRIDPELKEHLKIELLKYKDMESDIAPLGQDINALAAEIMAPEPPAPIVNPVQAIPPQTPR